MKKVLVIVIGLGTLFLSACETYEHLRSHPPACNSAKYSNFMGHTRQWVMNQHIAERWVFAGMNDPINKADPTRIAFFLEGSPELVAGVGCN